MEDFGDMDGNGSDDSDEENIEDSGGLAWIDDDADMENYDFSIPVLNATAAMAIISDPTGACVCQNYVLCACVSVWMFVRMYVCMSSCL